MIHVFFVNGMFGSTIEYVLTSFTKEYQPIEATILPDGSMHGFQKQAHFRDVYDYRQFFADRPSSVITTPTYPFKTTRLIETLRVLYESDSDNDSCILIYADNIKDAELNLLFQYHKIATGSLNMGLDIFCGENQDNIKNWNADYQHWADMQNWEMREWFSLFYVDWTQEWISSKHEVNNKFFKITNKEIIADPCLAFTKLIDFCHLTKQGNLAEFSDHWLAKQSYIIEEFNLLEQIVTNTIANIKFEWNPINIIAESIIQQRLRSNGYEIKCDGLNIFPTDSETLYNLLEKCYT